MKALVRKSIIKRSLVSSLVRRSLLATGNKRWQYNFDGIDDYIQLPTIPLFTGDVVEVDFATATTTYTTFLAREAAVPTELLAGFSSSGEWTLRPVTAELNGDLINNGDAVTPVVGVQHLKLTVTEDTALDFVGASRDLNGLYFAAGIIKNLRIIRANPTEQYPDLFYPINDGWVNNPIIREVLVGDGTWDGEAININEENWELV